LGAGGILQPEVPKDYGWRAAYKHATTDLGGPNGSRFGLPKSGRDLHVHPVTTPMRFMADPHSSGPHAQSSKPVFLFFSFFGLKPQTENRELLRRIFADEGDRPNSFPTPSRKPGSWDGTSLKAKSDLPFPPVADKRKGGPCRRLNGKTQRDLPSPRRDRAPSPLVP